MEVVRNAMPGPTIRSVVGSNSHGGEAFGLLLPGGNLRLVLLLMRLWLGPRRKQ